MATEQDVWRAVHALGAECGLHEGGMAELRLWAASRMREMPFAVFKPDGAVRASFAIAAGFAARRISAGLPADRKEN